VNTMTIGTVKKWKSCVLTTSVARTVTDIRTTATVLATKMHLNLSVVQSGKQRLWQRNLQHSKGILEKKGVQVMSNRNDCTL